MEKHILVAVLLATALVASSWAMKGMRHHWLKKWCFPDNVTQARCFKDFPMDAIHQSSWLSHILPDREDDTYTLAGTEGLDTEDFVVKKVEQDPKFLCQYRQQFAAGMACIQDSIAAKCPFMTNGFKRHKKITQGMEYICSRIQEMDILCLHNHWSYMAVCKANAVMQIRSENGNLPFNLKGGKSEAGHKYMPRSKEAQDGTYKKRKARAAASGPGGYRVRNSANPNYTSAPNDTAETPNRIPTHGIPSNKNYSARGSQRWKNHNWKDYHCYFKYLMIECVQQHTKDCQNPTSEILGNFMKNMSAPGCEDILQELAEKAEQKSSDVRDCLEEDCNTAIQLSCWTVLHAITLLATVIWIN